MSCTRLKDQATALANLPEDHDERRAAWAHAEACAGCRATLEEGIRLWALLGELPAPPPPSPEVMRRVAAEILSEPVWSQGEVREASRLPQFMLPIAGAAGWGALLALAKKYPPLGFSWALSAGFMLVACVLLALVLKRRSGLLVATGIASVALSVIGAGTSAVSWGHGGICITVEAVSALLPLFAVAVLFGRRFAVKSAAQYVATAAGGALAAQAALHITCPGNELHHNLIFHTGGVVVAAVLGLLVGNLPALRRARAHQ
ncbi:MAG: hypothetical protein IT371_28895 [Deltaproteobacteria bacterium]|nr:hypothetical protein [Deltaproteobacteria bacterium]